MRWLCVLPQVYPVFSALRDDAWKFDVETHAYHRVSPPNRRQHDIASLPYDIVSVTVDVLAIQASVGFAVDDAPVHSPGPCLASTANGTYALFREHMATLPPPPRPQPAPMPVAAAAASAVSAAAAQGKPVPAGRGQQQSVQQRIAEQNSRARGGRGRGAAVTQPHPQ